MRRILIIALSLILLGGIGWYVYKKTHSATSPTQTIGTGTFFPTGGDAAPAGDSTPTGQNPGTIPATQNETTRTALERFGAFTQITRRAVTGYTSFYTPVTKIIPADPAIPGSKDKTTKINAHFLRYVGRSNGYVYELTDGGLPLQISNIYIPNIYEAFFADNNQTAILRFLRDDQQTIATYSVPIPTENSDGTRTQKEGLYLPDNITSIAVNPQGSQLVRLLDTGATSTLTTTTSTNTKKIEILSSPLKEWLTFWPTQKDIYVQTKASYAAPGYLYLVDQANKRLRRVLGDINGLTTSVSPSGTYILYSASSNNGLTASILNTKTGTTKNINLSILPEKCTWMKNDDLLCAGNTSGLSGKYPDDWYMGVIGFSDRVYHIYTATNIYDVIYDGSDRSFDMTALALDESTEVLYFIDKPTGFLWSMKY